MSLRILWCSPLPPQRSGVAGYAAELLPALAERAEVRVAVPPTMSAAEVEGVPRGLPLVAHDATAEGSEIVLLHLGNNPFHSWIFRRAHTTPAVVVLHDVVLHHLLVDATVASGDMGGFELQLTAAHGDRGRAIAVARRHGLSGSLDPFLFPATGSGCAGARAAVVHSVWAAAQVRAVAPDLPVGRCALPVADPGAVDRHQLRQSLGLPADAFVVMHLGFLTEQKGLPIVLAALTAAVRAGRQAHLVLVGEGSELITRGQLTHVDELHGRVHGTGWVDDERLMQLPAAADLGVALRTPSAGETSAAVLRFLACGTPVAVNGSHQYLQWPDTAAPRITPGSAAPAELARLLIDAPQQQADGRWQARRRCARELYLNSHTPESAAASLSDFLGRLAPAH